MAKKDRDLVRIAAAADIHYTKSSAGQVQQLFAAANEDADVLLLAGDLTDYGLIEEAELLAKDLSATMRIPVIAVLGNHDVESGHEAEVVEILRRAGVVVLDGDSHIERGVGFAGIKGFGGGFGRGTLGFWGEPAVKQFVQEALDETLKLETALARLRTAQKIVLIHYAPIQATVEGEPEVIFPFLGTSRHQEPINRFKVNYVFHGHAHRGQPAGQTDTGIPVYNVSLPLMKASGDKAYRVIEVHADAAPAAD